MRLSYPILVCAVLLGGVVSRGDEILDFGLLTTGSAGQVAVWTQAQSGFSVEVKDEGAVNGHNYASFTFRNASGNSPSSICDVYFQDGTLFKMVDPTGAVGLQSGPGVDFSPYASPKNLPGGQAIGFVPTVNFFSADSDSPVSKNGINPGEWLKVTFQLQTRIINDVEVSLTFADVVRALQLAPDGTWAPDGSTVTDPKLRIGIHVQSFADGSSASFVNNPLPMDGTGGEGNGGVPLPAVAPAVLALFGYVGLGRFRKRA